MKLFTKHTATPGAAAGCRALGLVFQSETGQRGYVLTSTGQTVQVSAENRFAKLLPAGPYTTFLDSDLA